MKRLLLVLLFLPLSALAEIRMVSWTNATLNEDGTAFVAALDQEEIRLTSFKDSETTPSVFVSVGDATQISIDFPVGTNHITVQTVAKNGEVSQPSGVLTIVVTAPRPDPIPLPPSNLGQN